MALSTSDISAPTCLNSETPKPRVVAAGVPLSGAVWLARTNIFEKMFAPLPSPRYARAAEASWVKDNDLVLGVERNGEAVAYPVRQIAYHHVVMDEVGGVPVVATY